MRTVLKLDRVAPLITHPPPTSSNTCDMCHMTCDMWGEVHILSKLRVSSSYSLGVNVFWRFWGKGWLTDLLDLWINDDSPCFTESVNNQHCTELVRITLNSSRLHCAEQIHLTGGEWVLPSSGEVKTAFQWVEGHATGTVLYCTALGKCRSRQVI